VLYLLEACQKYEMASVQSSIRLQVKWGGVLGAKWSRAVHRKIGTNAIASAKDLIPEMENAARQALAHHMTFKHLGEGLRLF